MRKFSHVFMLLNSIILHNSPFRLFNVLDLALLTYILCTARLNKYSVTYKILIQDIAKCSKKFRLICRQIGSKSITLRTITSAKIVTAIIKLQNSLRIKHGLKIS